MLDSNLLTKYKQNLGNPVPDTVKGAVVFVGGIVVIVGLLNGALIAPLLTLLLILGVFTWREEVLLDVDQMTYTKKQGPWLLRSGKTAALGTPEFIALRQIAKRDGGQFVLMKSATSISLTVALLAVETSDDMLIIMQGTDADEVVEQAHALATHFGIPLKDERY